MSTIAELLGGLVPDSLAIPKTVALWLFLISLPVSVWAAWNDMRAMKIPNMSVVVLTLLFVAVAPFLMPLNVFGWQMLQLVVVLVIGILMNAGGLIGAGDAKFAAAAAPYIYFDDLRFLILLFAATLLAAVAVHRGAKISPLRKLAPEWESWKRHGDFPMGLALGGTLSLYLLIGLLQGS